MKHDKIVLLAYAIIFYFQAKIYPNITFALLSPKMIGLRMRLLVWSQMRNGLLGLNTASRSGSVSSPNNC